LALGKQNKASLQLNSVLEIATDIVSSTIFGLGSVTINITLFHKYFHRHKE